MKAKPKTRRKHAAKRPAPIAAHSTYLKKVVMLAYKDAPEEISRLVPDPPLREPARWVRVKCSECGGSGKCREMSMKWRRWAYDLVGYTAENYVDSGFGLLEQQLKAVKRAKTPKARARVIARIKKRNADQAKLWR